MRNNELINGLQNAYDKAKLKGEGSAYKDMLEKEYIRALADRFDVDKIYRTKDGRYKTSQPIQVCRKDKVNVLKAVYLYYYGIDDSPTIETVYDAWIKDFKELVEEGHRSWDTYDRYKSDWERYFENTDLVKKNITEVKVSEIKKFYRKITAHQSITRKSLSNAKCLLNHIFDFAVDNDIVTVNLARGVNTRDLICKEVHNETKVYSDEERKSVMTAAKEKDNAYCRAILLMFCLCVRVGEIEALKWDDIDLKARTVFIHSSMRRTRNEDGKQVHIWTDTTKGRLQSGQRLLPLSDTALKALISQKLINANGEFVFMDNGHPLDTTQLNRWLKRCCESAGVPYLSSHKIRFTTVTMMIDSGVSLGKAQKMAGHARPSTTEEYIRNRKTAAVGLEDWNGIFN